MSTAPSTLIQARALALHFHDNQKYGVLPYSFHLSGVADLARMYDLGNVGEVLAWLHDIDEDTDVTMDSLRSFFGDFIADCIEILSNEKGKYRNKERKLVKWSKVKGKYTIALHIKLLDRFFNVKHAYLSNNFEKLNKYKSEHIAFKKAIQRSDQCLQLWEELDRILFTYEWDNNGNK